MKLETQSWSWKKRLGIYKEKIMDSRTYTISSDAFGMILQTLTKHNMSYSDLGAIAKDLAELVKEK